MDNAGKIEDAPSSKKDETIATNFDVKLSVDSKNIQCRIVRGTKKMRIDSAESVQSSEQKKDTKDEESAEAKIVRSLKRSCELWSTEDKNTFFKAVNEFGKDFDALQSYFLSQGKKRGLSENMIKNKEQIRHFYYRTWLKISKHLKFSEDTKKACQEIYGLINYGELRRKLPRIHEKVLLKLNELIYWGSTQVRLRGKTMRIKTPICRALRKLNQLEDWQEEIKLPPRVTIELRPGNNVTWWQVQAHSMNPRVRTLLPVQRRLSSLLMFLQQRWKPSKFKVCINSAESLDQIETKDNRLLRVTPPEACKIALPVVNLGEYLTSNSVSFNSYEKRLGLKSSRLELLGCSVQYIKGVGKKSIKKYKVDNKKSLIRNEDRLLVLQQQQRYQQQQQHRREQTEQQQQLHGSDRGCGDGRYTTTNTTDLDESEHNVDATIDRTIEPPFAATCDNIDDSGHSETQNATSTQPNRFPGRETVERIRLGWNIDEANTITVGDLFLMFGRESKVTLDYWWDGGVNEDGAAGTSTSVISTNPMKRNDIGNCQDDGNLCLALRKLLSIAKHNYGTSKIYDNTSGSNETVVSSRVPSVKESTFRRPLIPQVYHKIGAQDAFKTQLDKFTNRFCKRGRTVRQRSLIVQRVLPVTSYDSATSPVNNDDVTPTTRRIISSPLIEPTLPSQDIHQPDVKNHDDPVENNEAEQSITGRSLNEENPQPLKTSNSIITSATQILKEGEHQWLNSEVADFSLSSFLGQLESPIKGSQQQQQQHQQQQQQQHHQQHQQQQQRSSSSHAGGGGGGHPAVKVVRPSSDVVSQMQCLMGESSVDYMAKFANLASQIASDDENKSAAQS